MAFCLLGLLPLGLQARNLLLEQAYWTDPAAQADYATAARASYTPYAGVLAKGFSPSAQWLRLRVAGRQTGEADTLVLRVRPTFLDRISVFDPVLLARGQPALQMGDWQPWQLGQFDSLHHAVVLPAVAHERYIWLRVETRSSQIIAADVLTPEQMLRSEHNLWMSYALLLAVILIFLLAVFFTWLRDRDPLNGWFVLRQAVLMLYTACFLGYHRILLADVCSPMLLDGLYNWLVVLATGLSIVFEYRLLADYGLPRWGTRLFQVLLACSILSMLLLLSGQALMGLQINMALNAIGILGFFLIVLALPAQKFAAPDAHERYRLSRRTLLCYHALVLAMLVLVVLPGLGLLQGTLFAVYGALFYSVVSGLMMTVLLIARSRRNAHLRRRMAESLYRSQQQLAAESRRREDQAQLLDMLLHELKNPLAVIDLAIKSPSASANTQGYVGRAVENMNAILERCVQTDRMVERPLQLQRQMFDLSQQIRIWLEDRPVSGQAPELDLCDSALIVSDLQCVHIIVANLIENAYKYGDPQQPIGILLVAAAAENGRSGLRLQVCNGVGEAGWPDPAKLFSRYYRSPAAQRRSGTGLGLYLAHSLARQLGGELLYKQFDQRICFELWLPT